ncbi:MULTISPECIES: alpha/beta hydrolase [Oceanobacillus]|uniref:Alpha/beta hydrolase n=1 Tax=Oceanobacillus aidingensis TaxID=645964 RepID=A0ABV9JYC8_9BACI|nr:alpha/beta hydrolase-fold protein [Oceanobacillus oncorhynchi]MDM8100704.1 alpha/beta hydrolase-fold protein [Oceanobacillus oncorhynchi]
MYRNERFQFFGKHHPYIINVFIPEQPVSDNGFSVLYILDGNAYGTLFSEMIKLQSRRSEKTGIEPMLLVGIEYEGGEPFHSNRVYDFTPPAVKVELPARSDGSSWPEHGGAEKFMDFLEAELIPFIDKKYKTNQKKQTIFGHSLGGLFVLYTLFQRSRLFSHYFACSPSIWWNKQAILSYETNINDKHVKGLFIAAEPVENKQMYANGLAMYENLSECNKDLKTAFFAPEGENHMSIVPAVFSRGMRFLHG